MSITATEKQEWIARIKSKLGERIAELETDHAVELRDIQKVVQEALFAQLGVTEIWASRQAKLDAVKTLEAEIDVQEDEIFKLLHLAPLQYNGNGYWLAAVQADFNKRAARPLRTALAATEWGACINTLRAEMDGLIDTVLIATSGKELRGLWARVDELLGVKPTALQTAALETA